MINPASHLDLLINSENNINKFPNLSSLGINREQ